MKNFLKVKRCELLHRQKTIPNRGRGIHGLLSFSAKGHFDIQCPAWILDIVHPFKRRRATHHHEGLEFEFVCQPRIKGDEYIFDAPNVTSDELPPRRVVEYEVLCDSCGFSAQICFLDTHKDQVDDSDYKPKYCSACGWHAVVVGRTYWGDVKPEI